MTDARLRALLLGLIAALAMAVVLFAFARREPRLTAPPEEHRPTLLLLSSLPLMFGEDLSLGNAGSPALSVLQKHYRVEPISVASPSELARGKLLLMAQPMAQPAEDLVALDQWVRQGGRVLLLADPLLEWPSARPPGDPTRPPPMFMDTGLLRHWGLRLDAPDKRGPQQARLGGQRVVVSSPGTLAGTGCAISSDGLVARCEIGKGKATVVADADLLDFGNLGGSGSHNPDALIAELATLTK